MTDRAPPRTQKEMLSQLWFAVIGTNGDGLKEDVREIRATQVEHGKAILALQQAPGKKAIGILGNLRKTLTVLLLGVLLGVIGFGLYHWAEQIPYQPAKTTQGGNP